MWHCGNARWRGLQLERMGLGAEGVPKSYFLKMQFNHDEDVEFLGLAEIPPELRGAG